MSDYSNDLGESCANAAHKVKLVTRLQAAKYFKIFFLFIQTILTRRS